MMLPFAMAPLGTMAVLFSGVSSTVVKIWISFTEPNSPCASIRSPTLYGLKSRISTPPAKLASVPCSARPTARPAAPSTATKLVVATPSIWITLTNRSAFSPQPIRLPMKRCSVGSVSRFCMPRSTARTSTRMIRRPMKSTSSASNTFGP